MKRLNANTRALRDALAAQSTPGRAEHEKAYLKSELMHLGTPVPAIRAAVKNWDRQHPNADLLETVERWWAPGIHELRASAVELVNLRQVELGPEDLTPLKSMLRDCRTWALLDGLATHALSHLVLRSAPVRRRVDRWVKDPDFWMRRAALLSCNQGLKTVDGSMERFGRLADPLLQQREFFIRKAIGWMLRTRSKVAPDEVADWLRPRVHRASGVTLREAIKYLPAPVQAELKERAQ